MGCASLVRARFFWYKNAKWNRLRLKQLRSMGMYADLQNTRERRQFYGAFQLMGTVWRICTTVM
jgi:hypothetical protein